MFRRLPASLLAHTRPMSGLVRPAPPPLPRAQQREFEDLVRRAQAPLSSPSSNPQASREEQEAALALHPHAPAPLVPEFDGDENPATGERGGPKREPVHRWTDEGDNILLQEISHGACKWLENALSLQNLHPQ